MITKLQQKFPQLSNKKDIAILLVPLLFLGISMFFYPVRAQFVLNSDEGVELVKAMLVDKGFVLYGQIWSDHPPLFTYILAAGFRLVGYKVGFSRYIVLFFSVLLVWSGGRILRLLWDEKVAIMGQVLIVFLSRFFYFSNAAMIGLPSVAFAILALWALLEWHHRRKVFWLIVSGLLLASSVLTKVLLGFLAPVFAVGLLIAAYTSAGKKFKFSILIPPLVFGLSFSLPLVLAAIYWIGVENLSQLWSMHGAAAQVEEFQAYTINGLLVGSLGYIVLAIVGIQDVIKTKKWGVLYILAWTIIAYLLLLNLAPVWEHHQFYLTVPLALLAAPLAYQIFSMVWRLFKQEHQRNFPSVVQIVLLLSFLTIFFSYQVPPFIQQMRPAWTLSSDDLIDFSDKQILAKMSEYQDQTNWVVTDLPIFAFRSQLPVPPEIANLSYKRIVTGSITIAEIIHVVEEYRPEQILIGRHDLPELIEHIEDDYINVHSDGQKALFIRKDIAEQPSG